MKNLLMKDLTDVLIYIYVQECEKKDLIWMQNNFYQNYLNHKNLGLFQLILQFILKVTKKE